MHNLILMQKCASSNFRKWPTMPQIWAIPVMILIFAGGNLSGVAALSEATGVRVTPWILPHFFNLPIMLVVYGFLTTFFFANAPFRDSFSQFLEVRVGKSNWIRGQVLYILEASLVYTLFYLSISILIILPRIYLTSDWGELIRYLAYGGGIKLSEDSYEISVSGISFYSGIIEAFSPLQAMALSMLLLFLVSAFLGLLIFAFQILMGRGTGVVAAGFLTFLSYFCCYVGWIMFEGKLLYISPVNWICMGYLDINGTGIGPDILYAVAVLTAGIIFFSKLGVTVYCLKDSKNI